jgi:hypothetical protein
VGTLVILAGAGVLTGNVLARTVGVILAGLSLVANFVYIPVYPLWALTVITLDALVIWALTAHGRELRVAGGPQGRGVARLDDGRTDLARAVYQADDDLALHGRTWRPGRGAEPDPRPHDRTHVCVPQPTPTQLAWPD